MLGSISNKIIYLIGFLFFSSFLFFTLDLFLGSVHIPFQQVLSILFKNTATKESWRIIIVESRLPKAIAAVLCGAALSISGLQMQTLFRNPLAGPYILGISSGAGLGVALFIMGLSILGLSVSDITIFSNYGIVLFSIIGSTLILLLLLLIINRLKDIMTVLILGIMIGSINTAIIGIIQYFSNNSELKSFIMWSMGNLNALSLSKAKLLSIIIGFGLLGSLAITKRLNAYLLGEDYAKSLGINITTTRF